MPCGHDVIAEHGRDEILVVVGPAAVAVERALAELRERGGTPLRHRSAHSADRLVVDTSMSA